jgi:hypothetical protein
MASPSVVERVERLSTLSVKRSIEPDIDLPGAIGPGQVISDELLSVHGLPVELTVEQRAQLSREEVASMLDAGIRFEAVLQMGFAKMIARSADITDPRVTYLCHEMGEETRHQRLFQRVVVQLEPKAVNPFAEHWLLPRIDRLGAAWLTSHPSALFVMVIAGEEIPDLLQKLAADRPDTDPFLAEVNRYHRQEEARHLSFARAMLPELWGDATAIERRVVRHVLPLVMRQMFEFLVHPGVYEVVGLPAMETWKAANRRPERVALRHQATQQVLRAVLDAGILTAGAIPKRWQQACGVDADGAPRAPVAS